MIWRSTSVCYHTWVVWWSDVCMFQLFNHRRPSKSRDAPCVRPYARCITGFVFFLFCDKNVLSLKNGPYSSATCDSGHGIRILQNCILNAAKSLSVGSPVTALPGLRVIPGIGWEERGRNRGNRNGGSSSAWLVYGRPWASLFLQLLRSSLFCTTCGLCDAMMSVLLFLSSWLDG